MTDEFTTCFRYHPGVDGDAQADIPQAHRYSRGPMTNQIQLYYSFSDAVDDPKLPPTRYVTEIVSDGVIQVCISFFYNNIANVYIATYY